MSGSMNVKPAFQVEPVQGKFSRMVTDIVEDVRTVSGHNGERKIITRKLQQRREEFSDGYMVYYPQGHSNFIAADDDVQLNHLGILGRPQRVDMNSGEVVPEGFDMSPKEIVNRATRNRPRARTTGGIDEALEGLE